jgi:MFS family permease
MPYGAGMASEPTSAAPPAPSTWEPLRIGAFRALWLGVLGSQVGTWMQTVGAQWLLVDEPNAATLVSLVQTATMLPVLLLALPAGVLADSLDRRRMMIVVQCWQAAVGAALTVLTLAGEMTPALLLTLTFLLGCGAAMTIPAYQAVIPELVPRAQLHSASSLGAISMNVARAVGPAAAGVLIAHIGVSAVFALNAATFVAFALVLQFWRRPAEDDGQPAEPFMAALRVGTRFVRHSPVMRRFLLRVALFTLPGVALWALLPLVASQRLGMGPGGYGLLLAALGAGAIAGAAVMPRLRALLSDNQMLVLSSLVYAAVLAVVALVPHAVVVGLALVPAGTAWMAVLSNVNAIVQMFLPRWVLARGLGAYQIVFFGAQGVGALVWGLVAGQIGLVATFLAAAAITAAGAATVRRWPLMDTQHLDQSPAVYWPEPELSVEPDPSAGPVVITVTYTLSPDNEAGFLEAMRGVRRSRMRTGAVQWGLFRHGEVPDQMVEMYVVPTWEEHLRQHTGRLTGVDQHIEERAHAFTDVPPAVAHLLPPDGPG